MLVEIASWKHCSSHWGHQPTTGNWNKSSTSLVYICAPACVIKLVVWEGNQLKRWYESLAKMRSCSTVTEFVMFPINTDTRTSLVRLFPLWLFCSFIMTVQVQLKLSLLLHYIVTLMIMINLWSLYNACTVCGALCIQKLTKSQNLPLRPWRQNEQHWLPRKPPGWCKEKSNL